MRKGRKELETNDGDPTIFDLRPLTRKDQHVVWDMLMHAAHETSSVRQNPILRPYAHDFGTHDGDMGVIATSQGDGMAVGAAWVRLLPKREGFGFIAEDVSELAIAVLPEYRGNGVGSRLLHFLITMARAASVRAISLSCREGNPAFRLYERLGFVRISGSDVTNRTGGISFTMILELD